MEEKDFKLCVVNILWLARIIRSRLGYDRLCIYNCEYSRISDIVYQYDDQVCGRGAQGLFSVWVTDVSGAPESFKKFNAEPAATFINYDIDGK